MLPPSSSSSSSSWFGMLTNLIGSNSNNNYRGSYPPPKLQVQQRDFQALKMKEGKGKEIEYVFVDKLSPMQSPALLSLDEIQEASSSKQQSKFSPERGTERETISEQYFEGSSSSSNIEESKKRTNVNDWLLKEHRKISFVNLLSSVDLSSRLNAPADSLWSLPAPKLRIVIMVVGTK